MAVSSAICMVQEERDKIMNKQSVQRWRPSQGTRQDSVEYPGTGSERLYMLESWRGEGFVCRVQ
jgi:hypothetical protein